ncbi:MAG TPA: hypothetical protein VFX61_20700, partial [Micromonosporaceae bacterium]|nr:hypothetical protein [Micromonosporaceae bacterium]
MPQNSLSPPPPRRARRAVAALLVTALLTTSCTGSGDEPGTDDLRSALAEVTRSLPAEPIAAVERLVADIHLGTPPRAQAATAELLRRSGIPVVSADGPVLAVPNEVMLLDVPVYAEFLPALTAAVRAGDRYSADQFATILQVTKITNRPLKSTELGGAVAGWGKEPGDHQVFVSAGAAVRALGAARGEVLHAKADPQAVFLDPLQTLLLAAHTGGRFAKVKPGAKPAALAAAPRPGLFDRLIGTGVAHAAPEGICGALESLLENPSAIITANANFLKGELQERLLSQVLGEKTKMRFDKASAANGILGTALSSILLMLGSRVQLSTDKNKTHFKHQAGSRAEHVKITAKATFDFKVAAKKLECYSLAGVSIPKAGPLEGFTIRWSSSQPRGGTIQEGNALLTAVSADSKKFTNGERTGKNGESTLEVKPPVEDPAGEGATLTGRAVFTATLDKENFPFKLDDLWALAKGAAEGKAGVASFAILKVYELIAELLTKAGLPSQSIA